jgi:hypothetical protein
MLKLLDLLAETLNLLFFLAETQEAMLPKYFVNKQRDANQDKGVRCAPA